MQASSGNPLLHPLAKHGTLGDGGQARGTQKQPGRDMAGPLLAAADSGNAPGQGQQWPVHTLSAQAGE